MENNMSDRAKQFMPFDALKGYKEELKKRERVIVPKRELTIDEENELNNIITKLSKKMMVKVLYFDIDEYVEIVGVITRLDYDNQILMVVNNKISFNNLVSIEIIDNI